MSNTNYFTKTTKEKVIDIILVVFGNFLLAVSSAYFILPFELLTGGVAGVSVVLSHLIPVSSEILVNIITISLFLVGIVFLGKQFAYKTVISAIVYPLMLSVLMANPVTINVEPLLASIYAGVLMGIGVGVVFRRGATTGGMDIPPLIIHKYTNIELSKLVLITDGLTVCLGFMVFGLESVLVGLISVYTSSILIDKVIVFGGQESKAIYIISDKYKEISAEIHKRERGTTLLTGVGGYTQKDRPVILTVISKKEYPELNNYIQHVDPLAFIIVSDATEVKGEGFSYPIRP